MSITRITSVNPVPNAQVCATQDATQVLQLPTYLGVRPLCGVQQNLAWGLLLHRMDHFEGVKCLVAMETELNCYQVLTQGFAGSQKDFFFHFSLVPNVFPLSSQWVPNMLPKFPMYSPTYSPQHLTLIPYALANCCPPFTHMGGPKGRNSTFQNRTFYLGEPPQFHFFV